MTTLNIQKRKIFKRRRDGQVAQGDSLAVSVSSSSSSSGTGEFNPAVLQDYAKKVDVPVASQKPLLDALSVEAGYIKYQAAALSINNADKLGGVVASAYWKKAELVNDSLYLKVGNDKIKAGYADLANNSDRLGNVLAANYARKDTANIYQYAQTINADLYINGNIIQNGSAYETHAEHLNVESNLMQLNVGEPGSQITGVIPGTSIAFSGIEINRGSADPYYMGVVEGAKPLLKLGKKDSLEAIATREDSPVDGGVMIWNNTNKLLQATKDLNVTSITTSLYGNTANWKEAYNWGNHKAYNNQQYLGAGYNSGGPEKPNWFGSGKLQLQMLRGNNGDNLNAPDLWYDVLWMSSYTGGDVKKSNALVFSKYTHKVGFSQQNYDADNWGTFYEFYHTGNADKDTIDWQGRDLKAHRNLFALGNSDLQGNVDIHGYVGSPDYASGLTGSDWRITKSGSAELDELEIRKGLTVHELIVARERSVNGGIITSVANGTVKSVDENIITLKGQYNSFVVGDRVRLQQWESGTRYMEAEVTAVNGMTITLGNYINSTRPLPNEDLVQWGHVSDVSRQNFLYQTARGTNAGYFAVMAGVNSSSLTDKQVLRMGNLGGYSNDGYGIASKYGGKTYFELSNTHKSIAGILFDHEKLTAGNIQIKKTGDVINTATGTPYAFYNSGDFTLGKGQLVYDVATNQLTFGSGVTLTWDQITDTNSITTGISNAQNSADNAYDLADEANDLAATKITSEQATTITQNTVTAPFISTLNLKVGSEIAMGENATISWNKVTDTENVENKNDAILRSRIGTGLLLSADPEFKKGYNSTSSYDWNGNITYTRGIRSSDNPTTSNYEMTISSDGSSAPGGGGFTFETQSRPNAEFITKIIAKIPIGKTIYWTTNNIGEGGYYEWLSPQEGTGKFEEYVCYVKCGVGGSFSVTNYFYIVESGAVTWRVSYGGVYDVTSSNNITEITNTTLSTTDILAQNLQVGAANVSGQLTAAYIDAGKINSGYINTNRLEALSITGDKIAAGTITTTKLAANTITAEKIATGTITADKLAANVLTAQYINFDGATGTNMNISGKITATISGLVTTVLDGANIYESAQDNQGIPLGINMIGYQAGQSVYRVTQIGNGRGKALLTCVGDADEVRVDANIFNVEHAINVAGVATLSNGLILAGGAVVTGAVSASTNFVENGELLSNKYAAKYSLNDYLLKTGGTITENLTVNKQLYGRILVGGGYTVLSSTHWAGSELGATQLSMSATSGNTVVYSSYYIDFTASGTFYIKLPTTSSVTTGTEISFGTAGKNLAFVANVNSKLRWDSDTKRSTGTLTIADENEWITWVMHGGCWNRKYQANE